MPSTARPHILVVNGRKVRQPVFVIGAPRSGIGPAGPCAEAVRGLPHDHRPAPRGQRGARLRAQPVLSSAAADEAAATVLRDAFAQAWQVGPDGCLGCSPACREAAGVNGAGTCVAEQRHPAVRRRQPGPDVLRRGPGRRVPRRPDRADHQGRQGRGGGDAVRLAGCCRCSGPGSPTWTARAPNPFFGIETAADLAAWPGDCRWRPSARCAGAARSGRWPSCACS